jgi:hypothetical protein
LQRAANLDAITFFGIGDRVAVDSQFIMRNRAANNTRLIAFSLFSLFDNELPKLMNETCFVRTGINCRSATITQPIGLTLEAQSGGIAAVTAFFLQRALRPGVVYSSAPRPHPRSGR